MNSHNLFIAPSDILYMFPGMNPKDLQKAMKKLGIKQEEIDATEVIIKCPDKDLIIRNPQVSKVNAMGQETIQIVGDIEERSAQKFTEDDVKTVAEQAKVPEAKAREVLEKNNGDLAKSILELQK